MNMRNRFVKYCVLILIFQFINTSFLFSSFSNYSLRRVKDSSSALWQKLEISSDYKAGESLAPYELKLEEVEYKPLLASGSLNVTADVVAALEVSVAQALTAFNHKGDGRVSSPMTEANIATVSRKIIDEIARRYGVKVEIAGNEGQVEEGVSAIKVKDVFNADGERDVMLELDGIEGSAFLLSGRDDHPPIGEAGYEQGAWSAVSLMDAGNAYCADMYKLTVAYNGEMEDIDPAASPDEIMQKVALGMGYSGCDDPSFKNDVAVLMLDRSRHKELMAELQNMGFDIISLEHGDLLPLIIAGTGLKIDGKKFIIINAGGSHEEYIARAVAKNTPGAVQVSRYATSQLKNAGDLSGWSNFTRVEADDFKNLEIEKNGVAIQNQSEIQGNPVVVLTSITGMREEVFKGWASNFPGIETDSDTGDITLYSLVSTKEGLFVVRTRYHTDSLEFSERSLELDNDFYPGEVKLDRIITAVKDKWRELSATDTKNIETLVDMLATEGLDYRTAFGDYSLDWLELYSDTVLAEQSNVSSDVINSVNIMKEILKTDEFETLINSGLLNDYPNLVSELTTLMNDLYKNKFSVLLPEEKENILDIIAARLPYADRMQFYTALQPGLYGNYIELYNRAKDAAERFYDEEKEVYSVSANQEPLYRTGDSRLNFKEEELTLSSLIPTHRVSSDMGLGSSSFKKRSEEIDKGMFVPIVVLRLGSENYIVDGHARALAYLEKGINVIPAFVVSIGNPSMEQVANMSQSTARQGLRSIDDIRLQPLDLGEAVSLTGIAASALIADGDDDYNRILGNALIKSIIDTVREKKHANIFISLDNLAELSQAMLAHYDNYLEDWSGINLYILISGPSDSKSQEDLAYNIFPKVSRKNIHFLNNIEDIPLSDVAKIDLTLCDVTTFKEDADVFSNRPVFSSSSAILLVSNRLQGMLFNEMVLNENSAFANMLDNPDSLVIAYRNLIRSFLPEDMRPAPEIVTLNDLSVTPKGLEAVIADVESAVNSAQQFGHPALVAVDGWEGAGRGTVIDKIKAELQVLHPGYRIGILDIENYYLPKGEIREESSVIIPEVAGESAISDNGIEIRRENDNNITIVTPFDEITLALPGIGQEIKVKGHEIYIERVDSKTLSIRLSPVIASIELGQFYRDIQNLQQGKSVYTQLSEGGMLEMNPQDYDVIFVRGELTLHQENINSLYNLRLFVDADYSARLERIIRQHIFDGLYSDVKTSDLPEYLNQQRATLEDQFLFTERDRADYTVLNNVYPSDALLGEIYKLDLSQRIDKSIKIAAEEGQTAPWVVLKDYILPVVGLGSNFREVIQKLVDAHESNIVPFDKNKISPMDLEREEISINILNSSEKGLLSILLRRIGLLNESS